MSRSPVWREIEPAGEHALGLAARRLEEAGAIVFDLELPKPFNGLHTAQTAIVASEGGVSFLPEYINANALLSEGLKEKVDNVLQITREQLLKAYTLADACRPMLDEMFGEKLDVILTPSSKGEAPVGLHTTGDAVFNRMWTLLHAPNLGIPVCFGPAGLPVGVTLVGPRLIGFATAGNRGGLRAGDRCGCQGPQTAPVARLTVQKNEGASHACEARIRDGS